jgi:hypothetical protein
LFSFFLIFIYTFGNYIIITISNNNGINFNSIPFTRICFFEIRIT